MNATPPVKSPPARTPTVRRPFRRRDARTVYARAVGPNMTPMVDVVMVILVFFMASAAFLGPEWFLRTLVPQPADAATDAAPRGAGDGRPATPADPLAMKSLRVTIVLATAPGGATTVTSTALGLDGAAMNRLAPALAELARGAAPGDIEVLVQPGATVPWRDVTAASEAAVALGLRTGIDPR